MTPKASPPFAVEKRSIHTKSEAGRSCRVPVREGFSVIEVSKGPDPLTGGRSVHKGDTSGICPTIATGEAIVGDCGAPPDLNDYTAIGDTVNIASRIESQADPGQVLISPATADLLPERIAEEVGEFSLKGIAHPLVLYSVRSDAAESLKEVAA